MTDSRRAAWDKMARRYDLGMKLLGAPFGGERRRRAGFLDLADIRPGMRVLDVACATGVLTQMAAERAGESGIAVGVDYSPRMVREAKRWRENAVFVCADAGALPFAAEAFDRVIIFFGLHELGDDTRLAFLGECRRVLKPGGLLAVADYPAGPKGIGGLLARVALRLAESPSARVFLSGRHLEEIASKLAIERTLTKAGGLAQVTLARR